MHSRTGLGADVSSGPALLLQLGRLIVRPRNASPHGPSTSQVQVQPKSESDELSPHIEAQLNDRVHALWTQQIPICIEVLLGTDCLECRNRPRDDRRPRLVLIERWTMRPLLNNGVQPPTFINPQWLLNAVRSQLHFSQLSAWLAKLEADDTPAERRRKLSRETCNFKKVEANCDQSELSSEERKLNVVYSITVAGDPLVDFTRAPTSHNFPVTDIGNKTLLEVCVESRGRSPVAPRVRCGCSRRLSREHDDLAGKLNDLTIGSKYDPSHMQSQVVDDRMLTPCSENGKHKCSCDDESDGQKTNQPKKLDERRLKEIAKYKRRLRKESKLRKLCDSTSSEGDHLKSKEPHTSIPILQAARFDRLRAIGCYRNQTYLTLPASRIETKSPFVDTDTVPPTEFKRTNTISTQTDDLICPCGNQIEVKCDNEANRMVRSDGNYDLTAIERENGARRKCEEDNKSIKKLKCDNSYSLVNDVIKRPKLRKILPVVDKIGQIISDREAESDIKDLHLKSDDSVFSVPKESKRQKTDSVNDDNYVLYEKCDYGIFEKCNAESPSENGGFKFPKAGEKVPSPSEMDRFRWRFDSAASMVFHTKTGLPLTSSPAPLRRGNNCFDFDDSINGVSGIKSALFPSDPRPAPPPPRAPRPASALLGSFEESALKGRLEPVATVAGFTAELAASGAFCPPHRRLPVTVFFYAPGGTNAPYMGHINLGPEGYHVARSGTIQVSLFNPHGTLVKMFVVLYSLAAMPPQARTFLRQRTLYMPAGAPPPEPRHRHKWLRYLIHLRFMTSKSGKLYLHTDIRILVSRKADLDTATAHSAIYRPIPTTKPTNESEEGKSTNQRSPNRVFGGCGDFDGEKSTEICYENQNGVSYELRSFTYAPDNPKYSPR